MIVWEPSSLMLFQFEGLSVPLLISFLVQIVPLLSCEFPPMQHILQLGRFGSTTVCSSAQDNVTIVQHNSFD